MRFAAGMGYNPGLMAKPNIILTGFMGTGKSTVGALLARHLGYELVDTDALIAARAGRTIAAIFEQEGEAAFRGLETAVAGELAATQGKVIATGGRLMLDARNAAVLGASGRVFCLTAAPEVILSRVAAESGVRPLLDVADPAERVRTLLAERAAGYGRFAQVRTDRRTPEAVAAQILRLLAADVLPVVHPTGSYNVVVGQELLAGARALAEIDGPLAVVTDSNVAPLYRDRLADAACAVVVPAGEQFKTLETVRGIYDELLAAGIDRKATLLALGGGVVGDMTGFAAATYMRGLAFVQCPTTLLAMVDASVGGKTGVDLPQGKNLIGAFKQPQAVLADVATLATLPGAELAAGMAEVIKHGLIGDPALFAEFETGDWDAAGVFAAPAALDRLQTLVARAIEVKRDVVQEDPFEHGRRATLNLGHTFGHAIEQVSGYRVRHGFGVAMGLVAAANLSARLGYCEAGLQRRIEAVLGRVGLPARIPAGLDPEQIYAAMFSDKKKAAGRLRFVLMRDVGDVFVTDTHVADTAVAASIVACQRG